MEVNDKVLAATVEGLRQVHSTLIAGGTRLEKSYSGPEFFDYGEPVPTISTGVKACHLAAAGLVQRLEKVAKEREDAVAELGATQEELKKANDRFARLLAGHTPCAKCLGFGEEDDGGKCKQCDGAAFAAPAAA